MPDGHCLQTASPMGSELQRASSSFPFTASPAEEVCEPHDLPTLPVRDACTSMTFPQGDDVNLARAQASPSPRVQHPQSRPTLQSAAEVTSSSSGQMSQAPTTPVTSMSKSSSKPSESLSCSGRKPLTLERELNQKDSASAPSQSPPVSAAAAASEGERDKTQAEVNVCHPAASLPRWDSDWCVLDVSASADGVILVTEGGAVDQGVSSPQTLITPSSMNHCVEISRTVPAHSVNVEQSPVTEALLSSKHLIQCSGSAGTASEVHDIRSVGPKSADDCHSLTACDAGSCLVPSVTIRNLCQNSSTVVDSDADVAPDTADVIPPEPIEDPPPDYRSERRRSSATYVVKGNRILRIEKREVAAAKPSERKHKVIKHRTLPHLAIASTDIASATPKSERRGAGGCDVTSKPPEDVDMPSPTTTLRVARADRRRRSVERPSSPSRGTFPMAARLRERSRWKNLAEALQQYRQEERERLTAEPEAEAEGAASAGKEVEKEVLRKDVGVHPARGRWVKIVFSNVCYNVPLKPEVSGKVKDEERLFDVSDLQHEPPLISKCGSLEVTFTYDPAKCRMMITVHRAREIPAKDRGGANCTQVRLLLLPSKKQRFKTKVKEGQDPAYEESFAFNKIGPEEVAGMGLRFRLYGLERMRRERMLGESVIGFASLNMDLTSTHWVILEPRSNLSHGDAGTEVSRLSRSDSASSTQSLQHGGMPELLLGLAYSATTGRLAVQVLKGSNFRNMASSRAPDTYVKVALMSATGEELQHCKTSVRRGQPNPLFKETFMLQVALFQLPEVTLMVAVYSKRSMKKKEMIGWFSLGQNSSGEEESSHWSDMRESKGEEVCRWHVLLES